MVRMDDKDSLDQRAKEQAEEATRRWKRLVAEEREGEKEVTELLPEH